MVSNIAETGPFAMRHLLLFLLILGALAFPAWAQEDASVYEVTDVVTDVTADSAAHARDQAVAQAQRAAFGQLVDRLGAGASVATKLSDDDIYTLVKNFEVQNERASAVRYIGTFTVQFKPAAVRALLGNRSANYSETPSAPVIILPVLNSNGHPILWEDKTKWRAAWETTLRNEGLVPVIIPAGELDDIGIISTAEAVKGKNASLKALIDKYQAGGVAVATLNADLDKPDAVFKIDVAHYDADGDAMPVEHLTLPVPADKAGLDSALVQAVKLVRHQLEKDWRQDAQVSHEAKNTPVSVAGELPSGGPTTHLMVTVSIENLAEWAQIKRKLDSIPYIDQTDVITLQRGSSSIELEFHGSIDALQVALLQQNLVLKRDPVTSVWTLQPSGRGNGF